MQEYDSQPLDENLFQPSDKGKLVVTEAILEQWRQSSNWAYKISFMGFLLLVLLSVYYAIAPAFSNIVYKVIYIGLSALVFLSAQNMFRYSYRIKNAAVYADRKDQEDGLYNLVLAYGYYGVLLALLVLLSFVVLF